MRFSLETVGIEARVDAASDDRARAAWGAFGRADVEVEADSSRRDDNDRFFFTDFVLVRDENRPCDVGDLSFTEVQVDAVVEGAGAGILRSCSFSFSFPLSLSLNPRPMVKEADRKIERGRWTKDSEAGSSEICEIRLRV